MPGRMSVSFSRHSFLSLSPAGFHRIAYLDWGKRTAAQVVVCVHGLSRNGRDFDWLARYYRFSTYLSDAASLIARITAPAPPVAFGVGHAPALMSYDQIAAVRAFLLRWAGDR